MRTSPHHYRPAGMAVEDSALSVRTSPHYYGPAGMAVEDPALSVRRRSLGGRYS